MTNKEFKAGLKRIISNCADAVKENYRYIKYNKNVASDAVSYGSKKREEAQQIVTDLEAKNADIIRETNAAVKKYCEAFAAERKLKYSVRGEELNADAQLLSFDLTASDLKGIIERNADNHTIRRLVSNYATKRGIINIEKHENVDLLYNNSELTSEINAIMSASNNIDRYLWRSVDEICTEGGHFDMMRDTIYNGLNEALPDEA